MGKLVSLLLTTYNNEAVIGRTLASIEAQDYPFIEICVADSCSTDNTLKMIEEFRNHTKYKVVMESKKDSGIYEGLNNAYKLSSGDYVQVMNDELTVSDAISKLVRSIEELEKTTDPKTVIGAHSDLIYAEDGKVVRYWRMGQGNILSGWMPAHPTLMLKREVYEHYGLYDTSYVSASDYEFIVRILIEGGKLAYVPEVLISMYYGGTSNAAMYNYVRSITESLRGLKENHVKHPLIVTMLRTVRVALQFVNNKNLAQVLPE